MRVREAATRYASESGRLRTDSSRQSFLKVMALLESQCGKPVEHITCDDLTSFCLSRNVAPGTVRVRRAHVRSLWEWLTYKHLVRQNVASDLKFTVIPGNYRVRAGNWLTELEVADVLRAVPDSDVGDRDRIILMAGLMCGLRRAEIASLRWNMLSGDLSELTITGKGQKLATIGVPQQLGCVLSKWRDQAEGTTAASLPSTVLPSFRQVHIPGVGAKQLVCWDRPLGVDGITAAVRRAGDRAGHPTLAPHDLRRTFAGLLEAKGIPVQDISKALRHANIGVTSTYLEQNPRRTVAVTADFRLEL